MSEEDLKIESYPPDKLAVGVKVTHVPSNTIVVMNRHSSLDENQKAALDVLKQQLVGV